MLPDNYEHISAPRPGRAYAFVPRRLTGAPLERASLSSIAFITKSITDVSAVTQ
jgi:hypothetical protein